MTRCKGWRRYGGVFTLGPVKWEQCKNDAVVTLRVKQQSERSGKDEVTNQPACLECWNEGVERGIKIISSKPIKKRKTTK